jgi:hypothetical protein
MNITLLLDAIIFIVYLYPCQNSKCILKRPLEATIVTLTLSSAESPEQKVFTAWTNGL